MKLQLPKGVRDFAPKDMIVRQKVIGNIREAFERFGFSPLETPVFERYDILTAKFAAGEGSDIMSEIFKVADRGDRELGLRFDMTVPFARYVGMNPELKMPFKRYAIGRVYRDGPIKLGRYREFIQCDADVVGCKSMVAEADIVRMTMMLFDNLDMDAYLELNNRKILFGLMNHAGVSKEKYIAVITAIDKLKKIGLEGVRKELGEIGLSKDSITKLEALFSKCDIEDREKTIEYLRKILATEEGKQGLAEIEELFGLLKDEVSKVKLNVFLARGLGYYTGTVMEGFLLDSDVTSSICGGGRYDQMIGEYLESKKEYPAVGISFGIEPITEAMKLKGDSVQRSSVTDALIIPIGFEDVVYEIMADLRKNGVNTDMAIKKGLSKNLQYADYYKIPYAVIIGGDELAKKVVKLKDMATGQESEIPIEKIAEEMKRRCKTL